ncbi:hypothetical protein Tco_0765436 [Tanacetum coccineum]
MINQAIKDSKAYKIYLAYATGAVEEEEPEPAKKDKPTKNPATKRQSSGVQIRDTPGVSVSKKKTPAKVVPNEPKGKSTDTSEGTGVKPGILDVSIDYFSETADERTNSDDEEEETQDDEYVHTPEHYVLIKDETNDELDYVTEEDYERINEELYGDVNVSLTDVEPADKEKDDEEMKVVGHVNVNQEGAGNQVKRVH